MHRHRVAGEPRSAIKMKRSRTIGQKVAAQDRLRESLKENADKIQKQMDARRPAATAAPTSAAR